MTTSVNLVPNSEHYREDIKGVSRNSIREVRDNSNAVPAIGGFIEGCLSRQRSVRKSRGRFRT